MERLTTILNAPDLPLLLLVLLIVSVFVVLAHWADKDGR